MGNFLNDMAASGARYKAAVRGVSSPSNLKKGVDVVAVNTRKKKRVMKKRGK